MGGRDRPPATLVLATNGQEHGRSARSSSCFLAQGPLRAPGVRGVAVTLQNPAALAALAAFGGVGFRKSNSSLGRWCRSGSRSHASRAPTTAANGFLFIHPAMLVAGQAARYPRFGCPCSDNITLQFERDGMMPYSVQGQRRDNPTRICDARPTKAAYP